MTALSLELIKLSTTLMAISALTAWFELATQKAAAKFPTYISVGCFCAAAIVLAFARIA